MATRRTSTKTADERAQQAVLDWTTFTWARDTQPTFYRLPHILMNYLGLIGLGILWYARWANWWLPLSIATLFGLLYTIARAWRHVPAHRKVVSSLYTATLPTCGHPRITRTNPVDPTTRVIVRRWKNPKTPSVGAIVYSHDSAAGSPATRRMAEDAIAVTTGPNTVFDYETEPGRITFEVVRDDDVRLHRRDTRRWIDSTIAQLFPLKRGHIGGISVEVSWEPAPTPAAAAAVAPLDAPVDAPTDDGVDATLTDAAQSGPPEASPAGNKDATPEGPALPADTPQTITVGFGAYDVSERAFRDKVERFFDASVKRDPEWIYDWTAPGMLTITAVPKTSAEATRKRLARKVIDTALGAVTRAIGRTGAAQAEVEVTNWAPEGHPAANTPTGIRIGIGTADFSSITAQHLAENTLDQALEAEWPDRIWLPTWEAGVDAALVLEAVPRTHQRGLRRIEEKRLREVVSQQFPTKRGEQPVRMEVTAWRSITDEDEKTLLSEKPTEATVFFGTREVGDYMMQLKAENHFDSLYPASGWSYDWDPAAGLVRMVEVPALPDYILFPAPGTEEFKRLEDLARQGIIVFGPAKGGGDAFVEFDAVPHALCGGNTGSGKSVLLTIVLFWALYLPDVYELVVCDPKRTDFTWTPEFPNVRFAGTIPEIQAGVAYGFEEMNRRQDLLGKYGVEKVNYLHTMAQKGLIPAEEVPRRLLIFFDEMASFFTDSKTDEIRVLQGEAREHTEQITMLGRAPWVNVFGAAQKPTDKNLGTQIRELLGNKIGIGWMKPNMSEQVLGSNLASTMDRAKSPKGRGWLLTDGQPDKLFQTYYFPKNTEEVPWAGDVEVPGVVDVVRDRLRDLGYQQVDVPNQHGGRSLRWIHPDNVDSDESSTPASTAAKGEETTGTAPGTAVTAAPGVLSPHERDEWRSLVARIDSPEGHAET